jgi:uncharacterized membrane protein YphA (DoxX/SURF4 family)
VAFDPRLGRAFAFDEEDLRANRDGVLSAGQRLVYGTAAGAFRRMARRNRIQAGALVAGAAVAAWLGVAGAAGVVPWIVAVGLVLAALVALVLAARSRRAAEALEAGRVERAEGELEVGAGAVPVATVGGIRFAMEPGAAEVMEPGARYRVCFLPTGSPVALLAVERTDPA